MDWRKALERSWVPLGVRACWEGGVAGGWLDPALFPPPSALAPYAAGMIRDGELPRQLSVTLTRMFSGYGIGAGLGLICGVLMGAFPTVRRAAEPVVAALYTTPKLALLPLLILIMGIGEQVRITLIALACFIMVSIHGLDAVRNLSPTYLEIAANYGADRFTVFRRIYIPASLPQLFTGLRLAIGRALMVTIAVELISCPDGIGHMLWLGVQTFSGEKLYVGVVLITLLGTSLHWGLRGVEQILIPWKPR